MEQKRVALKSVSVVLFTGLMISLLLNSCQVAPAAYIKLPNFFADHMVLQREQPIPIWGKAEPGGLVTVELGQQKKDTVANEQGKWLVMLDPENAGGPFNLRVIGEDTTTFSNVLIGEVWICSGQSNMGWPVKKSEGGEKAINTANFPNIRLFTTWLNAAIEPLDNLTGEWDVCSPKTVGDFSAAAFFFGRKLHNDLKVPVGLIETQVGGTPAEAWMTRKTLEKEELFRPILEYWDKLTSKYPDYHENFTAYHKRSQDEFYGQIVDAYWKEVRELQKKGLPRPPEPKRIPGDRQTPEVLFNAMLKPFVPMAIKGVFWYQGEANTGRGYQYQTLFPALINDWREAWQRPELPFIFVQLPFIHKRQTKPVEKSHRAEVRFAQLLAHKNTPHTGMVITIDTGREDNDHPFQKLEVGMRAAYWALADVYDYPLIKSGPIYDSAVIEGNKVSISFLYTGSGLTSAGRSKLKGFAIAGPDSQFVWADAKIEGNKVIVWNDSIDQPLAVRYGWADHPIVSLVNSAGFPASPFRTDNWPWISERNLSKY